MRHGAVASCFQLVVAPAGGSHLEPLVAAAVLEEAAGSPVRGPWLQARPLGPLPAEARRRCLQHQRPQMTAGAVAFPGECQCLCALHLTMLPWPLHQAAAETSVRWQRAAAAAEPEACPVATPQGPRHRPGGYGSCMAAPLAQRRV